MRASFRSIEAQTIMQYRKTVVTIPGTQDLYLHRYPNESPDKFICIRNGFEEENFSNVDGITSSRDSSEIHLVHSGLLHPSERDPSCFFSAIALLKDDGFFQDHSISIILRATGYDHHHAALLEKFGIIDIVRLAPGIAYSEALREMMNATGLIVFQAANCNNQVPAKIYEYFRAGRPILAITDPRGDTAKTLKHAGYLDIAKIDNVQSIKSTIRIFIRNVVNRSANIASPAEIQNYSRRQQTSTLAKLFDEQLSTGAAS